MKMGTDTGRIILQDKSIAVVGAGVSGTAAARLASREGAKVRVLEKRPDAVDAGKARQLKEQGVDIVYGEHSQGQFEDCDMVILSPGIPAGRI
ncbi:MAG: NAD(P)-binding protein, partial [Thermodesulfobacteriota bacterium]